VIDDRTLLRKAQSGDYEAFGRLQRSMDARLRKFATRLIGSRDVVDDVVQKAFTSLYLKLEKQESVEHLWPFMFRVVRHLCYDELRRQRRYDFVGIDHGSGSADPWEHTPLDTGPPPDNDAEWWLVFSGVREAMNRLPEMQRQALILHAENGLTYQQTADAMEIEIGTVKAHIHNARKRLRTLVSPDILRALGVEKEDTNANR